MTLYVLLALIALCILLGEALFVTMGLLALVCWNLIGNEWTSLDKVLDNSTSLILAFQGLENELIVAIPLFTLAGSVMTHGGISQRLVAFMRALMGWLPGGLPIACIVACCFFAAISGSSAVTIIAVGGMLYPALQQAGYSRRFALGLLTACGAIGTLVVPALPLVAYSVFASNAARSAGGDLIPVEDLYKAGVMPTLLAVLAFAIYSAIVAIRTGVPRDPFSPAELGRALWKGSFALLMPALLIGLLFTGLATVVETSAVSVIYAILLELVIYREIGLKQLGRITIDSARLVGAILVIMAMALSVSEFLVDQEVPIQATDVMRYDRVHGVAWLDEGGKAEAAETHTGIKVHEAADRVALVPRDDVKKATRALTAATELGIAGVDSLATLMEKHRGAPWTEPPSYDDSAFTKDKLAEVREAGALSEAEAKDLAAAKQALARLAAAGAEPSADALTALAESDGLAGSDKAVPRKAVARLAEAGERLSAAQAIALINLDLFDAFREGERPAFAKPFAWQALGWSAADARRVAVALADRSLDEMATRAALEKTRGGQESALLALTRLRDQEVGEGKRVLAAAETEALTALMRERRAYEKRIDDLVKLTDDSSGVRAREVDKSTVVWAKDPLVRSKLGFLIGINIILLLVGCIMDIFSGIIVIAPLVVPVAIAYDVNLVHLGIIFAMNLEIGFATPPFGLNLFVSQSFFRRSVAEVFAATMPFLLLLLGVLAAITYWEPLVLFLVPKAAGG